MSRRKAREYVLQMLFQSEFTGRVRDVEFPEDSLSGDEGGDGQMLFAKELFSGTVSKLEEIDSVIRKAAENWELARMAAVDRNILRAAVYELLYRADIPPAVTINEALEIAKKYSSLESVPFINGLLDKIARDSGKK